VARSSARTRETPSRCPIQFSGREYDTETQLYYGRARYLDPALGRFVSEDPIGLDGGINLYALDGNDPVNGWRAMGIELEPADGGSIPLWRTYGQAYFDPVPRRAGGEREIGVEGWSTRGVVMDSARSLITVSRDLILTPRVS
jgi:RHS repeat-associated protein